MKRLFLLLCATLMILFLFGCSSKEANESGEKYSLNGSVALGAVEPESLDKTKVTYTIAVSGSKQDIENIDAQEPLINLEYKDLMLENGPHHSRIIDAATSTPYLEIAGSFVFDTKGKTKVEIDDMGLFRGIKIIDKNKEEYLLEFGRGEEK